MRTLPAACTIMAAAASAAHASSRYRNVAWGTKLSYFAWDSCSPEGEAPPPREPRGSWPKVEAGQLVEVAPGDAGYVGSWYLADVLALKERQRQLVIEYHDFEHPVRVRARVWVRIRVRVRVRV